MGGLVNKLFINLLAHQLISTSAYMPILPRFLILPLFLLFLRATAASGQSVPAFADTTFTVLLIGDAGQPLPDGEDPTLNLLRRQLLKAGKNSAVIFLGDNIYPKGLPNEGHPSREEAQRRLTDQLKAVKDYPGKVFFVPGNHDWERSGNRGWQYIVNQQKFVESFLNQANVFLPKGGCPGPIEVSLTDNITLVMLDTQWWLHPWDKPGVESDCAAKDPAAIVLQLEDVLRRNRHKQIIVAAHHPMYSYSQHGGYNTWKQHVFPLADLNKNLYIPLPGLGSLYPLYRQFLGDAQDIPHPLNRLMRESLMAVFRKYPGLIYVDGHDHALQYIERENLHFIVSGSGSKTSAVRKGPYAKYVSPNQGVAQVAIDRNGKVSLSFLLAKEKAGSQPDYVTQWQRVISSSPLPAPAAQPQPLRGKTEVAIASINFRAGGIRRWLLGKNYREEWLQPVRVPVLDLSSEKGGLIPLNREGSYLTKTLRLKGSDGNSYLIRSLDKKNDPTLPRRLQRVLAAESANDQISAAHPYAPMVIPSLSQAAGVGYTHPRPVWVPDDPKLGPYRESFANTLAWVEEAEPRAPASFVGKPAGETVSTNQVLEKMRENQYHRVDQHEVLRARLFDIVIADWDRHDDQWRWLAYPKGADTLFRPLPRNRDQAFAVHEGWFPRLVGRDWSLPPVQGFGKEIRNVNSLMYTGRHFDRSFLNSTTREAWQQMADSIRLSLSDEVIEKAIRAWPDSIFRLSGPEVIARLKVRRDRLPAYAEQYYRFLAREVDVVGSREKEFFEVKRLDDQRTRVSVYASKRNGTKGELKYQRDFVREETREIRLYGLEGNDEFDLSGKVDAGIKVRIIGGRGDDQFFDRSQVKGRSSKTLVYDTPQGNRLLLGTEARLKTAADPDAYAYNREAFEYPSVAPLIPFGYNIDDGVVIGAGVLVRRPGFQKWPFAASHRLTGQVALATGALNFHYDGFFTRALGPFDLQLKADVQGPNYLRNFFGLGNESVFNQDEGIDFYRVGFQFLDLNALLVRRTGNYQRYYVGLAYQAAEVERTVNNLIDQVNNEQIRPLDLYFPKFHTGLKLGYVFDNRDNKLLTTRGTFFHTELTALKAINGDTRNLTRLTSELSFFLTFRLPARFTLANRVGTALNFGNYEFYQAATLGGLENLRGFRRTRFAGQSSFYNNTELRFRLFGIPAYQSPIQVGALGFFDVGRVWLYGENSSAWHQGYGGGLWLAPTRQIVLSAVYGFSREESLALVRLGFFF
jgi:hypothetical protein